MAAAEATEDAPKKKSKIGIILLILLGLGGIAGGGYAGYAGLIPLPFFKQEAPTAQEFANQQAKDSLPDISTLAFVELPRVVIPLGQDANAHHLVAQFTIETTKGYEERIKELEPRIMNTVNTYLRAVEEKDITDPTKFQRLIALMLNRLQLVAGDAALRNILVQEFILQ